MEAENGLRKLAEQYEQLKEDNFLLKTDLEHSNNQNIALRGFIQNLYESCEGLEDTDLALDVVLKNLQQNIRVFARDHSIRL